MLILNWRGVARYNTTTEKWDNLKYSIIVDGQMYQIKGMTKGGSLRLKPVNGFTSNAPEPMKPGEALARLAREAKTVKTSELEEQKPQQLSLGEALPWYPLDLNWPALNLKIQKYMYYRKDGKPTTPQERMGLALQLTQACGVTEQCAWNWSKDDAGKPHRKNLISIAQFFQDR